MNQPPDPSTEIEALKHRLNLNADDVATAVQLGNLYYDLGDAAQAIVYYQHAVRLNPDQPGVWTDMGTMYWQNGNVSLAERVFRHVVQKHPGFGNAYLNLGMLLRNAKHELKHATAIWKELVERYPDHAATKRARELLAETFLELG